MRKLSLALAACLLLGQSAKACNPVATASFNSFGFGGAVLQPSFGFNAFTPFGVVQPAFGFNTFGVNAFATPFVGGFGGVNVAVATGGFRARNAVVVRGGGRAVVRTRTVVRGR